MAYVFTVNGSVKTLRPGWSIQESANTRNRFTGDILSLTGTYRPANDDVIVLTESGTTIFGGIIDNPQEKGIGSYSGGAGIDITINASDFNVYASRIAILTDTPRSSESLKARLTWIVGLLSAQSVTLDAGQATGPTLPAATYPSGQYLIDVLNQTMALANGTGSASWIWNIDYSLALSAIQAGTVAAPFDVIDGDRHAQGDITVEQPRPATYGNYDIVLGGQGTQAVTDSFTGNGSAVTFALRYALSLSYGGVTVGGVFETLGTIGTATWSYDSSTNSITRTSAPGVGVAISINYIAQFPVKVVADGGASAANRVVKIYAETTVFDIGVLQALANAYVTRDMDSPRTVTYNAAVTLTGIHPGHTQTITNTKRNLSGTHLVTDVKIVNIGGNVVQRQVTAVTSTLLPATLRQQYQQMFGASSGATAAGGVTLVTSTGVGGSGTTGKLPKWASPTTLSDSIVTDSGTGISVAGTLGWTGDTTSTGLVRAVNGGTHLDTSASTGVPTIASGTWSISTQLATVRGGTALDTSASTGVPTISGGTWSVSAQLSDVRGGTGQDTSGWNGLPSINGGTWTQNNVLTTNRVLIAAASNTVTSSSGLLYSGSTLTVNNTIATPSGPTDLTLAPTGNLFTNTASILPTTGYTTKIGSLSDKYLALYAGELWVETLVAQNVIATIGGRVLVCPTNLLVADVATTDTTLHFKYNNLANGDFIYFEALDRLTGNPAIEWIKVTSGASGSAGNYTYTVSRNQDGTGANSWTAGDACIDTGSTNNTGGYIDLYSVAGVLSGTTGPTIVGNVRTGTAYNNIDYRWAIGNLDGLYGYSGMNVGIGLGKSTAENLVIDPTNGLRIRQGTTVYAQMASSTFTLGLPAGNRVVWDGTNLTVVSGNVTINSSGIQLPVNTGPSFDAGKAYTFSQVNPNRGGAGDYFGIGTFDGGGAATMEIWNFAVPTTNTLNVSAAIDLRAGGYNGTTHAQVSDYAIISMTGTSSASTSSILLQAPVMRMSGSLRMDTNSVVYPGTVSGLSAYQTSYYLASHATWGLYTNTNIATTGGMYPGADLNAFILADSAGRLRFTGTKSGTTAHCGWDGNNLFPFDDNARDAGANGIAWKNVWSYAYPGSSDIALKRDVVPCSLSTDFLMSLRPVDFYFKTDTTNRLRHGLIMQEVPTTFGGRYDDVPGHGAIDYTQLVAPLISGFQNHEQRIAALEARPA